MGKRNKKARKAIDLLKRACYEILIVVISGLITELLLKLIFR